VGRKRDEVNGAGLIVVFAIRKAVGPSQRGSSRFCIPDIQIEAAADVIANDRTLRSSLLLRDSVRVTKNATSQASLRDPAPPTSRRSPRAKTMCRQARCKPPGAARIRHNICLHLLCASSILPRTCPAA
jgi:hypothetical protein